MLDTYSSTRNYSTFDRRYLIKIFNKFSNPGLKILKNICGIETNLNTYHLGYVLGPRINAGGRVGKCSHGANLLLSKDPKKVFTIASELENFNKERNCYK